MAKPAARLAFLQVVLGLGAVVVVARAFAVQVVQHEAWAERARERDVRTRAVAPRRGGIYDRNGTPLAATFEAYHLKVAVNELQDVAHTRRTIIQSLGVPEAVVTAQFRRPYPYFDGPFDAAQVQALRGQPGIHLEPLPGREHPMGALARPLLGRTDRESGRGVEGIEAGFDSLLIGTPGEERIWRDGAGRVVAIPGATVVEPRAGHDLVLTIDHELQGIAEGALRRAVEEYEALGGDVVILDVRSGEVLAIASLRTPQGVGAPLANAAALIEPNEPGSTAKIFTAGAMLAQHADTSAVSGEGGRWAMEVAAGRHRIIEDTHREDGMLTLGQAIQVSSNIAMSKFSMRLAPDAQFALLRGVGFGTQPGTGFPSEASGILRLPSQSANLRYTMPSWAMGYEFEASALQLAVAYAAIANGGYLLQPSLVREVRAWPSGRTVWRHVADTVRQAMPAAVASQLLDYLRLASDSGGTGRSAQLDRWVVIGKTGTAKITRGSGAYLREYRGAFAGIFPGDDPRFVLYVMIDQPGGARYYGGLVAAPIVRNMLVQALALPNSPLEPGRTLAAAAPPIRSRPPEVRRPPRRLAFPLAADTGGTTVTVAIPDLAGWTVREGIHAAHRRGLRVKLVGEGAVTRTTPAAGDSVPTGAVLTIFAEPGR